MAVLTADQLAQIRQGVASDNTQILNFTKTQANLAIQAIEDWFEANRGTTSNGIGLSTAINTATSPFVFTNAQKKALGKYWLYQKFGRE